MHSFCVSLYCQSILIKHKIIELNNQLSSNINKQLVHDSKCKQNAFRLITFKCLPEYIHGLLGLFKDSRKVLPVIRFVRLRFRP